MEDEDRMIAKLAEHRDMKLMVKEIAELYKVVQLLSGRERQIVVLRYGLNGNQALTQQQVADILKISRSYVSRIEKKAILQMRRQMLQAKLP